MSLINELKPFLKFNINFDKNIPIETSDFKYDGLIANDDDSKTILNNNFLEDLKCFKILASKNVLSNRTSFDQVIELPTTVKEINNIVETCAAKKKFYLNSSIKIKSYLLDKNEKKLLRGEDFIILTEKEIQLLELFLLNKKPTSKNEILSLVWNYSSEADTHTVETHIYRLRKKISDIFMDKKFILNNKQGYYL